MAVNKGKNKRHGLENLSKPGMTNNPKGRPKLSDLQKGVRQSTNEDISAVVRSIEGLSPSQIAEGLKSGKWTGTQAILIKAYLEDYRRGRLDNWQIVLNRALGKPKQDIDLRVEEVDSFTPDELSRMMRGEDE